jgi:hypothetical protein
MAKLKLEFENETGCIRKIEIECGTKDSIKELLSDSIDAIMFLEENDFETEDDWADGSIDNFETDHLGVYGNNCEDCEYYEDCNEEDLIEKKVVNYNFSEDIEEDWCKDNSESIFKKEAKNHNKFDKNFFNISSPVRFEMRFKDFPSRLDEKFEEYLKEK